MFLSSRLSSSSHRIAVVSAVVAALFAAGTPNAPAQSAPVPFASTAAGGGTVCPGSISTYAPLAANQKLVGDGCPAAQSTLNNPVGLAIDRFNNVAIADQTNNLVRVIYHGGTAMAAAIVAANAQVTGLTPQVGYIYTIVGGPQSSPSQSTFYCTEAGTGIIGLDKQLDGCPGAYAYVQPRGLAFDQDGNLFIANLGSQYTVRVFYVGGSAVSKLISLENPTLTTPPQPGYVYEIAGTGAPSTTGGDGGLAYKASLNIPRGLWIDGSENIYVADAQNGLIRRIDSTTGFISSVVGYCATTTCGTGASAGDGTPATSSTVKLNYPYGMVFDSYGNMFIADSGSGTSVGGRIRVVYAGGTLAGISNPVVGDIYTYAGGSATSGTQAQQATFQFVYGIGMDVNGYLYVNDYRNATSPGGNHVWRIDPTNGNILNIAGTGGTTANTASAYCNGVSGPVVANTRGDGCPGPETYLNLPQQAPVFDSFGNFYEAERTTNIVRYFTYNNTFPVTVTGSSSTQTLAFSYPKTTLPLTTSFTTDGGAGSDFSDAGGDTCVVTSGTTPGATICTNNVKFSPVAGNLRKGSISTASTSTLVTQSLSGAGSAAQLTIDPATTVSLGSAIKPQGVSVDLLGNVYLSDGTGKQVLKMTLAGGTPVAVFTTLGSPRGTATDSFGNVYVADATNNVVLQRTPGGTVSTAISGLASPTGLAADVQGDIYVSDTGNNRILRYSSLTGLSSTVNTYPQTLSAPTALAVDAVGNLYILDSGNSRILELTIVGLPQTVTLPPGVVPVAFALDHAGDLYLADSTSASLLVSTVGGSIKTLQTGLTTPVGLAIDANGDLFLADSAATSVLGLNRTVSTDAFATTNLNAQSLPTALVLNSIGDIPATLGSPLFTVTGNGSDFPAATSGNTCSANLALTAGAYCSESFAFAPTVTGARSAVVTFTPAAGTSVSANFSGTAVNLISTSLTITQTAPTTSTVSYGQSTTFVVKLTSGTSSSTSPTGTITFFVDGVKQTPQTIASAGNTLTNNLTVGTHIVSAAYSGDSVYASSNTSFSVTVLKSSTTTTVTSAQNVSGLTLTAVVVPAYTGALGLTGSVTFYVDGVGQGSQPIGNGTVTQVVSVADGSHTVTAVYSGDSDYATSTSTTINIVVQRIATTTALAISPTANSTTVSLKLSATVTAATGTSGTPSGTITFYNGTTKLGTVVLTAGSASLTTATSSNFLFTATYSGDGLFQPSTITVTETPDFAVLTPSANLIVAQGAQATATVSVVSVANYTGGLTATCTNMPVNSFCRFLPTPLPVSPGVNGNLIVEVYVGILSQVSGVGSSTTRSPVLYLMLLVSVLAGTLLRIRRKFRLALGGLLGMAALFVFTLGTGGCGRNNAATFQNSTYITPVGTYTVSVNVTDPSGLTHSVPLNVQVNSQ